MSRSAAVRKILLDFLREGNKGEEGRRIKLLLENVILEGTLDPARNEKFLNNPINGLIEPINDNGIIVLIDVAIRPLSDPEVHVGMNELNLFLDKITGIIN